MITSIWQCISLFPSPVNNKDTLQYEKRKMQSIFIIVLNIMLNIIGNVSIADLIIQYCMNTA